MGKKNRFPRSLTAVTLLLAGAALAVWLAGMYCLTAVTAEYAAKRYLDDHRDRASTIATRSLEFWLGRDYSKYENYKESRFWEAVSSGPFSSGEPYVRGRSGFLPHRRGEESFVANAIYDADGNCIEGSWRDFFYFEYLTQEQWDANEERSGDNARAFFDREKLTEEGKSLLPGNPGMGARAMRFTGTFDGIEFTPVRIEYIDGEEFWHALWKRGDGSYTIPGVVKAAGLQWITAYEDPDALPAGAETVTLYSDWFDLCYTEGSPSFSYSGKDYENVAALLQELGPVYAEGQKSLNRYEGLDLLILSANYCYTYDGETYYDAYYAGPNAYGDEAPRVEFYVASAVYCSPWRTAFRELWVVYLVTFLLALALVLASRAVIRDQLIRPARLVGEALLEDRDRLEKRAMESWTWREGHDLETGFVRNADLHRIRKNEVTRLETALDYAKKAEENRRLLTSHIAHELKTPLAVVHSYAEGLREHIAEEKRERYTEVILSETERLDAMVMELLDLSRLEAGKVKLARDEFDLRELAEEILSRFDLAFREKELRLEVEVDGEPQLTADEGRLGQVITNFAANAAKYATRGGWVRVRIQRGRDWIWFAMANDSPPIPDEELERIWDSFYQRDAARRSDGVGLGLAIARSIIDLHGGKCTARNVEGGVEFSFRIPT